MSEDNMSNLNNVEQIRDIIFGNQIREFDTRLNKLDDDIKSLEQKMIKAFSRSHIKLRTETERSMEVLEKMINSFAITAQQDRIKIKEMIDSTDTNLQSQISNQKDEFLNKLRMMKDNMSDEKRRTSENMYNLQKEIENALNSGMSSLSDDKLSRDSMAKMLLDMAIKVQGTDINSVLTKGVVTEK